MTDIYVGLINIGSDNGLSPGRCQAIIWTNPGILVIRPSGTNFSEFLIVIHIFSFNKMHLKMWSGKWRPFCICFNVLSPGVGCLLWVQCLVCVLPYIQMLYCNTDGIIFAFPITAPGCMIKPRTDQLIRDMGELCVLLPCNANRQLAVLQLCMSELGGWIPRSAIISLLGIAPPNVKYAWIVGGMHFDNALVIFSYYGQCWFGRFYTNRVIRRNFRSGVFPYYFAFVWKIHLFQK